MEHIATRIKTMLPSATLEMAQKSRELKQQGVDIISLSLGEPDFDTPDYIKEAGIRAIEKNYSKYPPVPGYMELREAIAHKLKRDNNLEYKPSQVVVSTGAKQSLANIFLSVLDPGDEVIIFAPYWVTYFEQVKLAEGVPVVIQSDISTDFKINVKELEEAITEKTKLVIFSSPCNPSGTVFTKEDLREIAQVIANYPEITIISDEIYELINFDGTHESIAQFPEVKEQTVIVNGVSKGFSMTGWRIGYIAAPQWLADACIKAQGQITSGTSTVSQMAALEAIANSPEKIRYMVEEFKERKELVVAGLNEIEGVECNNPQGAFYVFPDVSSYFGKSYQGKTIRNASDLALFILEQGQVSVVTGEAFGSDTTIRISYASSKESLVEAIKRIKNSLALLN
jgi:aspartate aminotransferase